MTVEDDIHVPHHTCAGGSWLPYCWQSCTACAMAAGWEWPRPCVACSTTATVRHVVPPCPTECTTCRWAEMTPWQRRVERVRYAIFGPTPLDHFTAQAHAAQSFVRAFTGAGPQTDYERHRDRFERTGDPAELERMLRHVQPDHTAGGGALR